MAEPKGQNGKTFKQDERKKNPNLHLFHVKQAVKHLITIDKCIAELSVHSNTNLIDSIAGLQTAREKLVAENAAYADANEILESVMIINPDVRITDSE